MDVKSTFSRLISLLAPYPVGTSFPPPATDAELQQLEQFVGSRYPGSTIPPALAAMWRVTNGSPLAPGKDWGPLIPRKPDPQRLFYSYMFMPVREVVEQCQALDTILALPSDPYLDDAVPSFPDGAVRNEQYSRAWLPFAYDGCGGCVAVDAAPGPAGVLGQVINYGRDDRAHFQLGASVEAFLERVVNDYEHKRMHEVFGDEMLYIDRLLTMQQEQGGRVWFTYGG